MKDTMNKLHVIVSQTCNQKEALYKHTSICHNRKEVAIYVYSDTKRKLTPMQRFGEGVKNLFHAGAYTASDNATCKKRSGHAR